jgi:8-amino-7-oxononanoate synthase
MSTLSDIAAKQLAALDDQQLRRTLHPMERTATHIVRNGTSFTSFSCNDYLGLSHHPRVKDAAITATTLYGTSATASRFVTGNHPYYASLEAALANHKAQEKAHIFGSGYLANVGTISALMGKGDLILADKLSHACMLEGAWLSGATLMRFRHNNLEHCKALLTEHRNQFRHCLVMTEHVFSMDGDIAPIAELSQLAAAHDAWLLVDDAHGLGMIPLPDVPIDIIVGTLSKSLASYGGFVAAKAVVIDYLQHHAKNALFSTALPPAAIAAAEAAFTIMQQEPERGQKALQLARYFTNQLGLADATSAIVPVIIGEAEHALKAAKALEAQGFLISAIRPPTVPPGTARLRFTFSANHDEATVTRLAECVKTLL